MRALDVCLEISSDSKNYFGFVVDEFSKRERDTIRVPEARFQSPVGHAFGHAGLREIAKSSHWTVYMAHYV